MYYVVKKTDKTEMTNITKLLTWHW